MDIPARIELGVGERWTVRLPGLGSAGYQWTWQIKDGAGVIEVTLAPVSAPARPPLGGEPPGNWSTAEEVEVHALRPGAATLHLEQKRSWQANHPPLQRHVLEVVVVRRVK
jgi:predicted secreted protein